MEKLPDNFGKSEEETPSKSLTEKETVETKRTELERDPRFQQVLEEKCLDYLKTTDAEWFFSHYSGEIAPSGYLLDKNGNETNELPSMCISKDYEKIKTETMQEFVKENYVNRQLQKLEQIPSKLQEQINHIKNSFDKKEALDISEYLNAWNTYLDHMYGTNLGSGAKLDAIDFIKGIDNVDISWDDKIDLNKFEALIKQYFSKRIPRGRFDEDLNIFFNKLLK